MSARTVRRALPALVATGVVLTSLTVARATAPTTQYGVFGTTAVAIRDLKTNLTWQRGSAPTNLTLSDARAYCQTLELVNQAGYRLPTYAELSSLLDETPRLVAQNGQLLRSYIDYNAFPNTAVTAPYWTATPGAGGHVVISFGTGDAAYRFDGEGVAVRCVRPQ